MWSTEKNQDLNNSKQHARSEIQTSERQCYRIVISKVMGCNLLDNYNPLVECGGMNSNFHISQNRTKLPI